MNNIIVHLHSELRWVALILLAWAIINAFTSKSYDKKHRLVNLFSMVVLHTQLIIGLILYFTSGRISFDAGWMKSELYRFYGMEHVLLMVIAIALITVGHIKSKKGTSPNEKFKPIRIWYLIGLILILASIPWPFREALGGSWY